MRQVRVVGVAVVTVLAVLTEVVPGEDAPTTASSGPIAVARWGWRAQAAGSRGRGGCRRSEVAIELRGVEVKVSVCRVVHRGRPDRRCAADAAVRHLRLTRAGAHSLRGRGAHRGDRVGAHLTGSVIGAVVGAAVWAISACASPGSTSTASIDHLSDSFVNEAVGPIVQLLLLNRLPFDVQYGVVVVVVTVGGC